MNFVMRAAIAVACIACAASVSAQPKEVAMPKGGPSKDELAAAFKERLESADKKIAETLNKPNGDDVCLAWSTLEVKSGQAASTQKLNLKKFAGKWRITN